MSLELWFAFAVYVVVATITPGPNNMMLLASGVNHGLTRSWPHLMGVCLGFAFLFAACGLGLGALFRAFPALQEVLKIVGALYLLWLAWAIASSGPVQSATGSRPPIRFVEAAAFQWVNPKAWVMALGAISTYMPEGSPALTLAVMVVLFVALGLPCNVTWVVAGVGLRRLLSDERRVRIFNVTMALALVGSLVLSLRP